MWRGADLEVLHAGAGLIGEEEAGALCVPVGCRVMEGGVGPLLFFPVLHTRPVTQEPLTGRHLALDDGGVEGGEADDVGVDVEPGHAGERLHD